MSKADEIRQYAVDNYIEPARKEGKQNVKVRAGDVHDALGLRSAQANASQALEGEKFRTLANVELVDYSGPPSRRGANPTFHYKMLESPEHTSVDSDDMKLGTDSAHENETKEDIDKSLREGVLLLTPSKFQELAREYLKANGFLGADIDIVVKMKI